MDLIEDVFQIHLASLVVLRWPILNYLINRQITRSWTRFVWNMAAENVVTISTFRRPSATDAGWDRTRFVFSHHLREAGWWTERRKRLIIVVG